MSTLQSYTSGTRLPASSNSGLCIFRSDTNNIEVSDGTSWLAYQSDGITFGDNSYVAQLDGNDEYLDIGDLSGTLGGASKCTISWWMKKPNTAITQARWWLGGGVTDSLFFSWEDAASRWFIGVGTGSSYAQAVTPTISSILDNIWYLWTFVYDGTQSTENDRVKLYKNTSELSVSRQASTVIPTSLHSTAGDDSFVGAYNSGTAASAFTDASFDDFAIFDDALTSTQVANIYNSQIYPSSSLKHLYRMENNVNDSVGSANGSAPNGVTWQTSNLPY